MKKFTTSVAIGAAAIVEDVSEDVGASCERFCLTSGIAALSGMIEEDAALLAHEANAPSPATLNGRPGWRSLQKGRVSVEQFQQARDIPRGDFGAG
jgi:putative transposase